MLLLLISLTVLLVCIAVCEANSRVPKYVVHTIQAIQAVQAVQAVQAAQAVEAVRAAQVAEAVEAVRAAQVAEAVEAVRTQETQEAQEAQKVQEEVIYFLEKFRRYMSYMCASNGKTIDMFVDGDIAMPITCYISKQSVARLSTLGYNVGAYTLGQGYTEYGMWLQAQPHTNTANRDETSAS